MKNWVLIAVLILIIILFSCQKKQESTSEVENNISLAVANLSEGKVAEGAQLLLDAVLLTRPSEYMPEGFEDKVLMAKNQFRSGNMGNALESVSDALLLVKPPSGTTAEKDIELPKEAEQVEKTEEIAPIAELVRNKILAAREQFQKGNADKGAVLILESLLLLGPR